MNRRDVEQYLITRTRPWMVEANLSCTPSGEHEEVGLSLAGAFRVIGTATASPIEVTQVELDAYDNDRLLLTLTEIELLDILSTHICDGVVRAGPFTVDSKSSCDLLMSRREKLMKLADSLSPNITNKYPQLELVIFDTNMDEDEPT